MNSWQAKFAWLRPATPALLAFLAATFGGGLLLLLTGHNVLVAFAALLGGAFGSANDFAEALLKTTPLLLCGLAVAVAFRAGIWNIGAEGQLLVGALIAAGFAPAFQFLPSWLGVSLLLLIGAAAGAIWGALAGWMKAKRRVQEVISTILLNFVAIELVRYSVHGPMMETAGEFPQSEALPDQLRIVRLLPPTRMHAGIVIAVAIAIAMFIFLFHTVRGYQLRALGANPKAARFAGMPIDRLTVLAMAVAGGLAGLGGAIELSGVTYRLYDNFSPGYGYTAIAVALMGKLHPLAIIGSAFLFGILEAGAGAMQRQAGVSAVVVEVLQGLVVLSMASFGAWQWWQEKRLRAPAQAKPEEEAEDRFARLRLLRRARALRPSFYEFLRNALRSKN